MGSEEPVMTDINNPIQLFIATQAHTPSVLLALKGRELNKTTLAEIANVGYSIVHRSDLALYDSLPPKLFSYMNRIAPVGLWNVRYLNYKKELLPLRKKDVSSRIWLHASTKKYSTWIEFRELVADTQMEFCKLFLISPAILQHYESGKTKYLPIVIKSRLEYFGMSGENIAYLAELPVGERTVTE
jgi:hypothetical protein